MRGDEAYRMGSVWSGYIAGLLLLGVACGVALPSVWMPEDMIAEIEYLMPYRMAAGGFFALVGLWAALRRKVLIFGRDGSFTIQKWFFIWPRHRRWENDEIFGLIHTPRRDTETGNLNQVTHRISLLLETGDMITLLEGSGDGFWTCVRELERATGRKAQRRIAPGF